MHTCFCHSTDWVICCPSAHLRPSRFTAIQWYRIWSWSFEVFDILSHYNHKPKCVLLGFYVMDLHKVMHNWKKKNDAWFLLQIKKRRKVWLAKVFSPPESILLLHWQLQVFWGKSLPDLHIQRQKVLPILPCKTAQAESDWMESVCEQQFSNLARDSQLHLGLDFDWAVLCFDLNHSIVALAVCLGSLSCWKVNLRPSLKSFADSNRFSSKIVLYLAPSILCYIAL